MGQKPFNLKNRRIELRMQLDDIQYIKKWYHSITNFVPECLFKVKKI